MRLSGGELRSRRLLVPSGREIRPTPGRVREALFSILGERILDARVLDLFAGSGVIGFEALSRGAQHVTFVEVHPPTAARLREQAHVFGVTERTRVVALAAERSIQRLVPPYDLVYADPPYAQAAPGALFNALRLCGAITPQTLVIYEHSAKAQGVVPGFQTLRRARYGEVALAFMTTDA